MRMVALFGLLITFPAILVALIGVFRGNTMMTFAAMASFGITIAPFALTMLLVRNQEHSDDDDARH